MHRLRIDRVFPKQTSLRRGLNMVEVAISSLIVGVMLIASLRVVGQSYLTQRVHADLANGQFLAEGLLSEIQSQSYMEPGMMNSTIRRETGELSNHRSNYDDVDDYHGYTESPPKTKDNVELPNSAGWQRVVSVQWVSPSVLTQTSNIETGVKRITVQVRRNGTLVTTLRGFRSNAP